MRTTTTITRSAVALAIILVLTTGGCRSREKRTTTETVVLTPEPAPPARVASEVDRLRSLALRVQTPRDRLDEAEAIKELRSYLSRNNMTYTIRALRTDSDTPVESPSEATVPVRVVMEIFRGRESLYTFTFVPRDNKNLALLGQ